MARRAAARAAAFLMIAAAAATVLAATMESATQQLRPASDNAGGRDDLSSSSQYDLGVSVGEPVVAPRMTSGSYQVGTGLRQILHYPGTIASLVATGVSESSVTLQWTSPGYDGDIGRLQPGSSYYFAIASYTAPSPFDFPNYTLLVGTQMVTPGAVVSSSVYSLLANTTYYGHIWTADTDGNLSQISVRSTFTVLANRPVALSDAFLQVWFSSITARWAALPGSPPDASSKTAEGYRVEASSTNFGQLTPGGQIYSSATLNVAASTLTVGELTPLDRCEQYYFRVAALNWEGAPNYATLGSTRTLPVVFVSTHDLTIGNTDVDSEVVISTSFLVSNAGRCTLTYRIQAEPITGGTPWTIADSSGTDAFTVQALFNGTQPSLSAFKDEDKLAVTPRDATATRFALGQSGLNVPGGADRLLWVKVGMPRITSTESPQQVRLTITGTLP